jgi:EAL domain-containing protein (putative c-di-GMP-specific phosphodiesterase class I)
MHVRDSGANVRVKAGAVLFSEGDPGDYAAYLERGHVEISVSRRGQRVVLGRKGPGELFGEMAIIDGRPRAATVTALTRCDLILITRDQLRTRLEQADPVLRLCLSLLMDRLRSTVGHIQEAPLPPLGAPAAARPSADGGRAAEAIRLEHELELALAEGQFELHYQPIVALDDSRVAGFEALIRWRHPERGLVPPGAFLPAAEASGFIRRIDAWALGEACAALRRFQAAGHAGGREELFVGVNVSAAGLTDARFLDHLDATVRAARVRPGTLKLEITETTLIAADVGRTLEGCRGLGVGVALDDFGTGYSSLSYLHRFPLDTLKLDRSFIQDVRTGTAPPPILRAIIRLAEDLRLPVVAEGIERAEQSTLLERFHAERG